MHWIKLQKSIPFRHHWIFMHAILERNTKTSKFACRYIYPPRNRKLNTINQIKRKMKLFCRRLSPEQKKNTHRTPRLINALSSYRRIHLLLPPRARFFFLPPLLRLAETSFNYDYIAIFRPSVRSPYHAPPTPRFDIDETFMIDTTVTRHEISKIGRGGEENSSRQASAPW